MEKKIQMSWEFKALQRGEGEKLLLLLHGYQQTAFWIFKLLESLEFEGEVIAPNGLFPLPYKHKDKWMMTYAWYFFEPETGKYIVEMDPAVEYLLQGVLEKASSAKEVHIVGFSQGGYLAPFVAQKLPNVKKVIGIGSRYRSEVLKSKYPFEMHNIHGADDKVVDAERARQCFDEVLDCGNQGEFITLDGVGHEITEKTLSELSRLLQA